MHIFTYFLCYPPPSTPSTPTPEWDDITFLMHAEATPPFCLQPLLVKSRTGAHSPHLEDVSLFSGGHSLRSSVLFLPALVLLSEVPLAPASCPGGAEWTVPSTIFAMKESL